MKELQYNRKEFIKNTFGAGMALALSQYPFSAIAKSEGLETFTLLHTNDWHSRIEPFLNDGGKYSNLGGAAFRSQLIKEIRSEVEHVLLVDSGDMFQGTPYFNFYGGELEFKLMSEMAYDCATLGNHDFDGGLDGLKKQLPHAKFDILSANYDFSKTPLNGVFPQYKIIKRGKIKIGITAVGIDLQGLVPSDLWKDLKYNDPIVAANKNAQFLKHEKGCDVVILLSHLGYKYRSEKVSDIVLAQRSENIDIVLGGHTHTFMDKPLKTNNLKGEQVLINQVGWGGIMLGRIDFTMVDGRVVANPQSTMLKVSKKST